MFAYKYDYNHELDPVKVYRMGPLLELICYLCNFSEEVKIAQI